jgi:hypothetical protein
MSCTIHVQGPSEYLYTKYKVSAYREGEAESSSVEKVEAEFELDRKTIVGDFQRLLPYISGEIPRFRSLSKFADLEDPLQSIFSIGARIYSALPEDLNVIEDAKSIHIKTDDLEMPWEVMGEGEEPICLKYSCGVSPLNLKRDRPPAALGKARNLKVLFIVDTKCNLPQTREEIRSITSVKCAKDIRVRYRIIEGKDAKYISIRDYIKDNKLDIIHVAAHAEFNESNPGGSGIVVNNGLLTAEDVYDDVIEYPPWLVFMNACESAKSIGSRYLEKYKELSGLADAFLEAGASSYIGTICKINDSAALHIATRFYDELLCNGSSVGQSMQNARKEFYDNHGNEDLSWLAFRLYGDPNLKRDFVDDAKKDMEEKVKEYFNEKKETRAKMYYCRDSKIFQHQY